ncbi:MAG: hypothetical protein ACKVQQ_08320 [Burkholderiales bacterium]
MLNPRMTPERIREIAAAHPWLPADYLRHLERIAPGPHAYRYGAQWHDGPRSAAEAYGVKVGRQFPEARLIARRHGNLIGYTGWAEGKPRLEEWGGSQERVVETFDNIAALTLSTVLTPGYDGRPILASQYDIEGLALGPWHDAGDEYIARGILLPDGEKTLLETLLRTLPLGWSLGLVHKDSDSWMTVRFSEGRLTLCLDRHGSSGTTREATPAEARAEIFAAAPHNDGWHPGCHFHLTIPAGERQQPHVEGMPLPHDILRRIAADYPGEGDMRRVRLALEALIIPDKHRVARCVLFAADRDFARFTRMVYLARLDYRDVILAGEYEPGAGRKDSPRRVRDFTKPFDVPPS